MLKVKNMVDKHDLLVQWYTKLSTSNKSAAFHTGSRIYFNFENQLPSKEFHKPISRKFKKHKVLSSFDENIWLNDQAGMQLITKYNKRT